MSARVTLVLGALFMLETVASSCATSSRSALYYNGRITTMNPDQKSAEAMAVVDGRIVAIGLESEVRARLPKPSQLVDLHDRRVIPGFIESHAHFVGVGNAKLNLDVSSTKSADEVATRVEQQITKVGPNEWLKGRGWDQNDWPHKEFPTHDVLSKVSPNHPVILTRIDGHALWCNQAALQAARIDATTKDPDGGKIIRDVNGNPTGVFIDNAMELIFRHAPKTSREQIERAAKIAAQEALRLGITSFHDAGSGQETIDVLQDLITRGETMPRLYVMLNGDDRELLDRYFASGPLIDNRLTIRSIKFFADGALGSRGAALLEPYDDDPHNRGLVLMSQGQLSDLTYQAMRHGFQVSTHAIGDWANRTVLDAYEAALGQLPDSKDLRLRIEHAQIVHSDDVARFKKLGIIASMQPTHCTSDMPWAPVRLGEERSRREAYSWRSFLDRQVIIAAGSDAPIEALNPIWGLYAATTRQDHLGQPDAGFYLEQKLTLEEALEAFTVGGALAEFQEHQKGRLAQGYLADFVVLDRDIFDTEPKEWLNTKVEMTVIGGKIVHLIE